VAAVLGADLNSEIRKNENLQKGDIDVEILLKGAEKLGEVYAMDGAKERITALRARYARVMTSIAHYEGKVARQTRELERMNRPEDWEGGIGEEDDREAEEGEEDGEELIVTDDDLRKEEEEIKELERKRKELEDRVTGMERDLGGLLR
jgi:DASH complex subunit Spc34